MVIIITPKITNVGQNVEARDHFYTVGGNVNWCSCCENSMEVSDKNKTWITIWPRKGFPGSSAGKEFTCNAGDPSLIPGWERSPGGRHGNPLPTHGNPSILAWRFPGTEEPSGLWSIGSQSQTPLKQLSTHMLDVYDCVCINMWGTGLIPVLD